MIKVASITTATKWVLEMSNEVTLLLNRSTLSLGPAVVGQSLNVWAIRGFAALDELATISIADVANDLTNVSAPQRHPDQTHAREALDYALGAVDGDADSITRFFSGSYFECSRRLSH